MVAGDALNPEQFQPAHPLSKWGTEHPADLAVGIAEKAQQKLAGMRGPGAGETLEAAREIVSSGHEASTVGTAPAQMPTRRPPSLRDEEDEEEED